MNLEYDFRIPFSFDSKDILAFRDKLLNVEVSTWSLVFETPVPDIYPGRDGDSRTWFEKLSDIFWPHFSPDEQVLLYGNFVQALLDSWGKAELLPHDHSNPVHQVCQIVGIGGRNAKIDPRLLACYQRLWSESPRPHSYLLQSVVECSWGTLDVSPAEVKEASELYSGDALWLSTVVYFALGKGWSELATTICTNYHQRGYRLSDLQVHTMLHWTHRTLPTEMVNCLREYYPKHVARVKA